MHIVDGALSTEILLVGSAIAVGGISLGLKNLTLEQIPRVGIMSAVFFVTSLIHFPFGFFSVHLILSGLTGMLLGWAVFPAIAIGLLLQTVFFGYGGLTVLGVNILNLALPALIIYFLTRRGLRHINAKVASVFGGIGGACSIFLSTLMVAFSLYLSGDEFLAAAHLVVISHLPVMGIEAVLTASAIYLIHTVKPEFLEHSN